MIIKEKRWLSRFVAMLCVLTMVVGVLTPASVEVAAATSINKIKILLDDDFAYYNSLTAEIPIQDDIAENGGGSKEYVHLKLA